MPADGVEDFVATDSDAGDVTADTEIDAESVDTSEGGEVSAQDEQPDEGAVDDSFTVVVNGQEQQVSLDELLSGYQRQSDYTRKTQELAAERNAQAQAVALWEALNEDPNTTLRALAEHLGIDSFSADDESDLDPHEREMQQKLREHEAFLEEVRNREFERALDAQLDALEQQHGEFDRMAVLEHAANNNIGNLEDALFSYAHRQQLERAREERNKAALQRKRQAPPVASGGSKAAGSQAKTSRVTKDMSLSEALEAAFAEAKQEHGYE